MNHWLQRTYFHNTAENWLISAGFIIGSVLLARLIYWIIKNIVRQFTSRTQTRLDDVLIERLERPAIIAIILTGFWYAQQRLHFSEGIDAFFYKAFVVCFILNATWVLVRVLDALISEVLIPYSRKEDNSLDEQLLQLVLRIVHLVVWVIGTIAALNNAGFDVGALIAGLGIGGIALALAAQDTVKNIFGGLVLFLDKPFRLGDRIRIDQFEGFVESIGVRSTRLKTLEGRMVTIPNARFSDNAIENVTKEPSRRVVLLLNLTYNHSEERIQQAIDLVSEIIQDNSNLEHEGTQVFFETFGPHSLDIKCIYFIKKDAHIPNTQTAVNRAILGRLSASGFEFAYPTRTVYTRNF